MPDVINLFLANVKGLVARHASIPLVQQRSCSMFACCGTARYPPPVVWGRDHLSIGPLINKTCNALSAVASWHSKKKDGFFSCLITGATNVFPADSSALARHRLIWRENWCFCHYLLLGVRYFPNPLASHTRLCHFSWVVCLYSLQIPAFKILRATSYAWYLVHKLPLLIATAYFTASDRNAERLNDHLLCWAVFSIGFAAEDSCAPLNPARNCRRRWAASAYKSFSKITIFTIKFSGNLTGK